MNTISTSLAPQAIGPYSQAIISNGLLFTSGQVALDPTTMQIVEGGIETQTKRVLQNLEAILKEAKTSKEKVIKTTLFLKNMNDFAIVNQIYGDFFANHKPARSTVEVARLPKDLLIEIECIAEI
jgi:2-iminobutanoate/2-iminopropanoate deaminase